MRIIERCLLAIVVLNGLGAVFLLAGSIIGCMGTCCSNTTVSHEILCARFSDILFALIGLAFAAFTCLPRLQASPVTRFSFFFFFFFFFF